VPSTVPAVAPAIAAAPAAPGTTAASPAKSASRLEASGSAAANDGARAPMLRQAPAVAPAPAPALAPATPAAAALERQVGSSAPPSLLAVLRNPQGWAWQGPDDALPRALDAPVLARLRGLSVLPWQRLEGDPPAGPRVRWWPAGPDGATAELVVGESRAAWVTGDGQRFAADWSAEQRDGWR
jgi:hypothetical protein